jgi:RNA polymerase sigma-70 factor (ECF subfamily)
VDATVERRLRAHEAVNQVAELPDRQRDAVVLTAVQGHSGADAASMLGVTEGALHQLIHRARAALRGRKTPRRPN